MPDYDGDAGLFEHLKIQVENIDDMQMMSKQTPQL